MDYLLPFVFAGGRSGVTTNNNLVYMPIEIGYHIRCSEGKFIKLANYIDSLLCYGFIFILINGKIHCFPWEKRSMISKLEMIIHQAQFKERFNASNITSLGDGLQVSSNKTAFKYKDAGLYYCWKCYQIYCLYDSSVK